jgi:hypothetical protein
MADSTFTEIGPSDNAALSDGGFQRPRAPRVTSAPSIQRIPELAATIGSSGAVRNSIRTQPEKVWPFVNRAASISSKSKFPASLPLNH